MKIIIKVLPIALVLFAGLLSCEKDKEKEEVGPSEPTIVTLSAEKGPYMIVKLYGHVSNLKGVALDFECGIEYSTDTAFSTKNTIRQKVDKKYTQDKYSILISDIQPGKKYYYRAYCINQMLMYYGEIESFTFEWVAPDVETLGAKLNESGYILFRAILKNRNDIINELSEYYPNHYGYYGIEYSTSEQFEDNTTKRLSPLGGNNNDTIICMMNDYRYNTTYYYRAFFRFGEIKSIGETKTFTPEWEGPKVVDMGLSVKWATCNVGAMYPWSCGGYYAWGETETKSEYSFSNYKYCDGSGTTMTKYCTSSMYGSSGFVDNKTILEPEDDVAHVLLGGSWRMPTSEEFIELKSQSNCTWTETTMNGVRGYLVTSKIAGYENSSIFLPWAGGKGDVFLTDVGSPLFYWSSTVMNDTPNRAWSVYKPASTALYYTSAYRGISRWYGLCVRPVCQ